MNKVPTVSHGQRVGIFGGAFDPPHRAHRLLVETALAQLALDVCLVVPTGSAWHKSRRLSPASHRLAMTQLAFSDLAGVQVDDQELNRQGPSYTIDTVIGIGQIYAKASLFLLLGMDQWRAFTTWHRWETLLAHVQPVVACRAQEPLDLGASIGSEGLREFDARLPEPLWLQMPPLQISSTELRQTVARDGVSNAVAQLMLTPAVGGYISNHSLYSTTDHS